MKTILKIIFRRKSMIRRPLTMLLALGLLGAAGCGDDDTTAPPTHDLHAGPADMTVTARPDLAGGGGGGDDGDDSDDGGAESPPHAIIVPISPTGHDRFFGVAYDSAGSVYAVGQVGDSTVAGADISTVVAKFDASGKLDPSFGSGGKFIINV